MERDDVRAGEQLIQADVRYSQLFLDRPQVRVMNKDRHPEGPRDGNHLSADAAGSNQAQRLSAPFKASQRIEGKPTLALPFHDVTQSPGESEQQCKSMFGNRMITVAGDRAYGHAAPAACVTVDMIERGGARCDQPHCRVLIKKGAVNS